MKKRYIAARTLIFIAALTAANAQVTHLDDHFNNGVLATNPDTGGGFAVLSNGSNIDGSVTEIDSLAKIVDGTGSNTQGIISTNAFDLSDAAKTYTATWEVAAWNPAASGANRRLRFDLQTNNDWLFNGGAEESRVILQIIDNNDTAELLYQNRSGGSNVNHSTGAVALPNLAADLDGFTVTLVIDSTGYDFTTTGLNADNEVALSGTWAGLDNGGTTFAEAFQTDGDMHVSAFIQDSGGTGRTLDIDRITLTDSGVGGPTATIVSFTASPATVNFGDPVTLSWEVQDADSVTISGVGAVDPAAGSVQVIADDPTKAQASWTLTAVRGGTSVFGTAMTDVTFGDIDVYLFGGQSNMLGFGRTSDIDPALLELPEFPYYMNSSNGSYSGAPMFNQVTTLKNGTLSEFGPEIGFANRIRDLRPGTPIAFLKYSRGGVSLEIDWKPGANAADTANWGSEFTLFVSTMDNGLNALKAIGWNPQIQGMLWLQGEQDAKDGVAAPESTTSADDYGANLNAFIARVREQFASDAAPGGIRFVSAQVLPHAPPGGDVATRFTGRALVRQGILDVAEGSGHALSVANSDAVPTDDLTFPTYAQVDNTDGYRDDDEVHFSWIALLEVGEQMAYKMLKLAPISYADWALANSLVGGPDDDDDHDGVSNWHEYALNGTISNTPTPFMDSSGNLPAYVVSRNLQASETTIKVEFSLDLLDWTTAKPDLLSADLQPDGTSVLTFRPPAPVGDHGFFRTKIMTP